MHHRIGPNLALDYPDAASRGDVVVDSLAAKR